MALVVTIVRSTGGWWMSCGQWICFSKSLINCWNPKIQPYLLIQGFFIRSIIWKFRCALMLSYHSQCLAFIFSLASLLMMHHCSYVLPRMKTDLKSSCRSFIGPTIEHRRIHLCVFLIGFIQEHISFQHLVVCIFIFRLFASMTFSPTETSTLEWCYMVVHFPATCSMHGPVWASLVNGVPGIRDPKKIGWKKW